MKYETFEEKFEDLDLSDKLTVYNEHVMNNGSGEEAIFDFDDEFFDLFSSPSEVARAVFFGNIQSWEDPYIGLNAYGNIVTYSESQVEETISDSLMDIYEDHESWKDIIEDEEDEKDEEEEE